MKVVTANAKVAAQQFKLRDCLGSLGARLVLEGKDEVRELGGHGQSSPPLRRRRRQQSRARSRCILNELTHLRKRFGRKLELFGSEIRKVPGHRHGTSHVVSRLVRVSADRERADRFIVNAKIGAS